MLFINATLSKIQLYKLKNQRRHRVLFQIFLHVILLMSAIYFRFRNGRILICRYQGAMLRNNDKLFQEFFCKSFGNN